MTPTDHIEAVARRMGERCYSIKWGDGADETEDMARADAAEIITTLRSLGYVTVEEAAKAVERRAIELGRQECCGEPLYMIAGVEAASAIRSLAPRSEG